MSRLDELTASPRARRRRTPAIDAAYKQAAKRFRKLEGHGTNRPGDSLHRFFAGEPRDGDTAYTLGLLGMIVARKGDVPAIAAELGVCVRTLRGWMMKHAKIRSAVKVAQLEAQLEAARCEAPGR